MRGEHQPEQGRQLQLLRACGPRSRGRHTASSTSEPNASRSSAVPAGPTRSNSVVASAAPNCTEAMPPITSAVEGERASRPPDAAFFSRSDIGWRS